MIEEILRWGRSRPNVAAIVRTGSRATGGPVDALSDHDLVLFVDDPAALEGDDGWFREPGPVMVWIPERGVLLGRPGSARLVIYEDGGLEETKEALRRTIALHRRVGRVVAGRLGHHYPETIADEVSRHMEEMLTDGES